MARLIEGFSLPFWFNNPESHLPCNPRRQSAPRCWDNQDMGRIVWSRVSGSRIEDEFVSAAFFNANRRETGDAMARPLCDYGLHTGQSTYENRQFAAETISKRLSCRPVHSVDCVRPGRKDAAP